MIEFLSKDNKIKVKWSSSSFDINYLENNLKIWDFLIDFPWEYEKSWILVEVFEKNDKLFYSNVIDWKIVLVVFYDDFEITEDLSNFFWDVDVLVILGSSKSSKISDNIEARVVIPYWEWKDLFFTAIWQTKEELDSYKYKSDTDDSNTEYINLKN